MANKEDNSGAKEKKEAKIEVRDLKPRKDVKGGARKVDKPPPAKTGEVDFMNWD
jgi:hypothetical protein